VAGFELLPHPNQFQVGRQQSRRPVATHVVRRSAPLNFEVARRPDRGPPLPKKADDLLEPPQLRRRRRPDAFSGAMAAGMKRPVLSAGCHPRELLRAIA
jgi:hypothetical protein